MSEAVPRAAWLTVNRECNFRCRWCYAKGTDYRTSRDMSLELAKSLAVMLKQIGIRELIVIGGEPAMWRPLIEFNEFCANEGFRSVLVTNGSRFGVDSFWRKYKQHPNDEIGLSLKAATRQQLQEVAGFSKYDVVRNGISRALSELGANASLTYNAFYVGNLVDIVRFAVDNGAKSMKIDFCSTTFSNDTPDGTYMVEPQKLVEEVVRDYPEMERLTNGRLVFEMMLPFCLWPADFIGDLKKKGQILSVCHVHKREGLVFSETGELLMCNALFDYPIGMYGRDFNDGQSLLARINKPHIIDYYDRLREYPSERCAQCLWYQDCGGGCPLKWAIYKPDEIVRPILQ